MKLVHGHYYEVMEPRFNPRQADLVPHEYQVEQSSISNVVYYFIQYIIICIIKLMHEIIKGNISFFHL